MSLDSIELLQHANPSKTINHCFYINKHDVTCQLKEEALEVTLEASCFPLLIDVMLSYAKCLVAPKITHKNETAIDFFSNMYSYFSKCQTIALVFYSIFST